MSSYVNARRAALLSLFLLVSLALTVGPASAVRIDPPRLGPAAPPSHPRMHHSAVVAATGPGPAVWILVGIAAALVVAGGALLATRRHRRTHRAVLIS